MTTTLVFLICFSGGPLAIAKNKKLKAPPKAVAQKLNKQTNDELAKNEDIRNCYFRAKAGREKEHGVVFVDLEIGQRSEVSNLQLNKSQSTLSPEVGNCIVGVLKNLLIPFKSNERGKKISAVFRF